MDDPSYLHLSKRERQIMDVIYSMGQATAAQVMEKLESPPSYSAVRAKLRILEEKGYLVHDYDGPSYVYKPVLHREIAQDSLMKHLLRTFFDGSVEEAMTALIGLEKAGLTKAEKTRLSRLIEEASEERDAE